MANSVFSDYELDQWGVKIAGSESTVIIECVGSCEEEMETKVISKSCRGVVRKTRVKSTGTGTLKMTAHIPWAVYYDMFGMGVDGLIEGVKAYGTNSVHPEFSSTMHIIDEDGNEKFKAYPKCIIKTGVVRKIENGAEEVAEMELEVSIMPDDHGNGLYEVLASELKDETVATKWMSEFTPELVMASA